MIGQTFDAPRDLGIELAPAPPAFTVTYYLLLSTNQPYRRSGGSCRQRRGGPAADRLHHAVDLAGGGNVVWRGLAQYPK